MNDDEKFTHPSYGHAAFTRVTGGIGRLYGSAITDHGSCVELKISTSELVRDRGLSYEHYYARDRIITVMFSEAQFATLITTMNVSEGAPCTINRREGKAVESPPNVPLETEKIRNELAREMKSARRLTKRSFSRFSASSSGSSVIRSPTWRNASRNQPTKSFITRKRRSTVSFRDPRSPRVSKRFSARRRTFSRNGTRSSRILCVHACLLGEPNVQNW
jgi:hypothetical protein